MTDGPSPAEARSIPQSMAGRLIVALDVPTIESAARLAGQLDGVVSFFKIGLWLLFAPGAERFIDGLIGQGKQVFLDAKMFDIGETVRQGIARAAERGVSIVTVHGDPEIMGAAVSGRGGSARTMVFAISVLTSLDDAAVREMGYALPVAELIRLRVRQAVECGCDGIIASADDNPNAIRLMAGAQHLLIATPGIREPGGAADDHKRHTTPAQAIARGADYLVVGRPITQTDDPAAAARRIVADMERGREMQTGSAGRDRQTSGAGA
jgi:orotidine-5'-phosphate decarboxylase